MLTNRQKLSIKHLKVGNENISDGDIYEWAKKKLQQKNPPSGKRKEYLKKNNFPVITKGTRRHSKDHYRGILNHYADIIFTTD